MDQSGSSLNSQYTDLRGFRASESNNSSDSLGNSFFTCDNKVPNMTRTMEMSAMTSIQLITNYTYSIEGQTCIINS